MSYFQVDFNESNILLKTNDKTKSIPITSLLLNNGDDVDTVDKFETHQQQVNYLDSIKDGANVFQLQGLDIYPKSGNITFDNLKIFEHVIFERRADYLTHTTWLKVKKGSLLDEGKNYQACLWESGLGYQTYLADSDNVTTIKTFGSFIDPLEKQNAKEVWPPIGTKIELTKNFMKLVGYGENSSITATATSDKNFEYTLNIGCGKECDTNANACTLINSPESNKYFAGNNVKNEFLKTNATTKEKVKFIVLKGWGDKVQVLIYLILFHFYNEGNVVMTTCDMVVFMLCLNFAIPCIYTGAYRPKDLILEDGKKYYSILEYKPTTQPYRDAFNKVDRKLRALFRENESFITAINSLIDNPDTPIRVGGSDLTFLKDFYQATLSDVQVIQDKLSHNITQLLNKYSNYNEETGTSDIITQLNTDFEAIQKEYLLVPFLKIKKGTKNTITILSTKSYTAQKPANNEKPNVDILLQDKTSNHEKESKQSFLDLANRYFKSSIGGGKKYEQKGGSLTQSDIEHLFPADEDNISLYEYITNEDNENDSTIYKDENTDGPLFNPSINDSTEKFNLLEELTDTFNNVLSKYNYTNFHDTIYTLFVYESYLNGCANDVFTQSDLDRIIEDYEPGVLEESKKRKFIEDIEEQSDKARGINKRLFAQGSPTSITDMMDTGGSKRKTIKKQKKTKRKKNKRVKTIKKNRKIKKKSIKK